MDPELPDAIARSIIADPYDLNAYRVAGDWLAERDDPRGELIALQLAGKDDAAKQLIEANVETLLGPLAEHTTCYDGELLNNGRGNSDEWVAENQQAFLWKAGYIHRVRLSHDSYANEEFDGNLAEILGHVFEHPSGRFAVELAFMSNGDPNENNLQDLIDVVAAKAPLTVRKIVFGDNVDQISWHHTGDLAAMWKGVPNLRVLELETGDVLFGDIDAPNLERLVVKTGGLTKAAAPSLATIRAPRLAHLEIYYGEPTYGGDCSIADVAPLLARNDLPALRYLGVKNAKFQNDIAAAIAGSRLVGQLHTLDLSLGTMTDDGARALVEARRALANLDTLDLRHNYLTADGINAVAGLATRVITDDQQQPSIWGTPPTAHYYVAVSE